MVSDKASPDRLLRRIDMIKDEALRRTAAAAFATEPSFKVSPEAPPAPLHVTRHFCRRVHGHPSSGFITNDGEPRNRTWQAGALGLQPSRDPSPLAPRGAPSRLRTGDLLLTMQVLCRAELPERQVWTAGFGPATPATPRRCATGLRHVQDNAPSAS